MMKDVPYGNLIELLEIGERLKASDLILVAGSPPCFYINGTMEPLACAELKAADIEALFRPVMTEAQTARLKEQLDLDFSIDLPQAGRYRVNVHYQRGTMAAAMRYIPRGIPSLEDLNLPPILQEFAMLPQGLILITGATGDGKSTTLAAMLNFVNRRCGKHIITLEDPIEFRFHNEKSVIEQREIGLDTPNFSLALRHVLRQKPDVILVGELRDHETVATAITAAETGHLVMGTLHTMSAATAINRIVDIFEGRQQQQIRTQLAHTLQATVSQVLFKDQGGAGRIPACEILVCTGAVRRCIRDNETHLIPGMIETGTSSGMQTLDQAIVHLVAHNRVAPIDALPRLQSAKAIELVSARQRAARNAPIPPPAQQARVAAVAGRK